MACYLSALSLSAVAVAVEAGDFTYTTNSDDTITISGYTGSGGVVTVPSNVVGKTVVSIGDYAFDSCTNLTTVMIPHSVTNIGGGVFAGCIGLSAIMVAQQNPVFSSDIDGVLYNKNQTTLIQCPGGKTGDFAISGSVTNIAGFAFSGCDRLAGITIPTNVTIIQNSAFSWCSSLTSVAIPNSVTSIGDWAFGGCTQLASVSLPNGVMTIGTAMFQYCSLTNITIPNSVTKIGAYAFRSCQKLSSVIFGTNVTSIGNQAFSLCLSLQSITFPASVTNIGDAVFLTCNNLSAVYFKGNAPNLDSSFVFPWDATVYYLPKTTGWPIAPATFGGSEAVLWDPQAMNDSTFGVGPSGFGFTIAGPINIPIIVQSCTDLVTSAWFSLATNTLTGGLSYFSDPQWTNDSARFYRFCTP